MKKQTKLILLALIVVILIIISIFYFKNINNSNKKIEIKDNYITGIIKDKKITKEEQYLEIEDTNNKIWKINISENTIFKQKLKLEEGDDIKIKGKYSSDNNFNAIEISM